MLGEEWRMPVTTGQRLLEQLEEIRGRFGATQARHAEKLLETANRFRVRDPESLIRLHEVLLFLRAFPPSRRVVRQAEALLASFHARVEGLRRRGVDLSPLDPMEVSGIAGTVIEDCLNYDVSRWLVRRFPGYVDVAWDGYEKHLRLAETLPRFLPLLDDDAYVEADVPYLTWLRSAIRRPGRDLAWLLARFEALPLSERERAELFDSLELTIRWDLGGLRASRTRNWRTPSRIFYHRGPFIRRNEVDLVREMTTPLRVERLSRRAGEAVLDLMREVMTVRRRELWGTTHGDTAHVLRADVGRGLEIFLWGLPPERRLPLRAYVAGFSLKNGVPINYIEAIGLGEWLEVGFNTFYTFRDGESAWNYAQALRLLHEVLGVTCVAVYPYQIGQDNEEAIESGAFWFYRKLGFRPGRPDLLRIAEREEQKIAATPGYRTSARTLRRLADGHMFLDLPGSDHGVWDRFRVRHIGFAVQRRMAARWGGDARKMRAGSVAAVSRTLGVRVEVWTGRVRKAVEDLAPVLALIPDLGRWTAEEKGALVSVIRSKAAATEFNYLRRIREHRKLRDAIVRLGSRPPAFPISS
jgi:plasmid stabilization system protein ParE